MRPAILGRFRYARSSRALCMLLTVVAMVSLSLPAFAQLSDSVQRQISDVLQFKDSLSPAEQKLSTNLLFASRNAQGKPAGVATDVAGTSISPDQAMVRVAIRTSAEGKGSGVILKAIQAAGGQVDAVSPSNDLIEATVPVNQLENLAARPAVASIREPGRPHANVGVLTTQGFVTHRAKEVVAGGVNGTGVRVGVLSDSASPTRVAALKASGDLGPGTTVLAGQDGTNNAGFTDEGTAMMEIVQDMAPGAQLFFASAFNGEASFAANIIALGQPPNNCQVVVDDVSYDDEFPYQDATIAQGVNTFVANGGIYFSSAANAGNLTNGTATVWEGDFLDGGPYAGPTPAAYPAGAIVHNFGTAGSPVISDQLTSAPSVGVSLFWADPIGASGNDYDLFVTNAAGTTLKAFSIDTQAGAGFPIEEVITTGAGGNYSAAAGDRVFVLRKAGSQAIAMSVRTIFGEGGMAITTSGQTFGHNAGLNTQSTAATYWNSARIGTKPFDGTHNPIENFSSDGLRKIFFMPNGTAITPGNFRFSTNGGQTLQKPDFTAADGVTTKTPGFNPFYGTSAAAPHAASIAALVKSAKPSLTNTQIATIMHNTALDNMAPGPDRDGGVGVVMAAQAVAGALAPEQDRAAKASRVER